MKLFISGKGKFMHRELSPLMKRAKEFLDRSKDGELFMLYQVADAIRASQRYVENQSRQLPLAYSHRVGNKRYWGKPKTITQLKKETR